MPRPSTRRPNVSRPSLGSDKRRFNGKPTVYFGMHLIGVEGEPALEALVAYIFGVLDAIGIRNGAVHAEVKAEARGPVLIEANCRLHGLDGLWIPLCDAGLGYNQVGALADGVVVGSAFVTAIDSAGGAPPGPAVEAFVKGMVTKSAKPTSTSTATNAAPPAAAAGSMRSAPGSDGNWRKKVSSEPGARWSVEHAGLQRTRCIRARREGCAHAPCVLDVREISGASEQLRRVWRALCAGDSGGGAP